MEGIKQNSYLFDTRDEKLVDMASHGNTIAFSVLVERHSNYVTRLASRFLFKEEDISDLVQDTFIRVWKRLPDFDGRCLFTTWLYTIVFNLCIDRMRALKRTGEIQLSEDLVHQSTAWINENDAPERVDSKAIVVAVRKYSHQLSKIQRMVFILRDLQDLPVEEVCRITGYKPDKVKANLFHARKFIREKLLKGGYL